MRSDSNGRGQPAVVAEQLRKTYQLGELLRLEATVKAIVGRKPRAQTFEALRGVSFRAFPSECFGVGGANGSGKSTVLQILAGITLPSSGRMTIRGTVLPMLAVGAGFHLELTGRENSFLYGTILGLPRPVIENRLDGIAE